MTSLTVAQHTIRQTDMFNDIVGPEPVPGANEYESYDLIFAAAPSTPAEQILVAAIQTATEEFEDEQKRKLFVASHVDNRRIRVYAEANLSGRNVKRALAEIACKQEAQQKQQIQQDLAALKPVLKTSLLV